jgi:hypothetical protein
VVSALPLVLPVAEPVPLAMPVQPQGSATNLALAPPPDFVPAGLRRRRSGGGWKLLVLALVGTVLVLLVLGVGWQLRGFFKWYDAGVAADTRDLITSPQFNFILQRPPRRWTEHASLKATLNSDTLRVKNDLTAALVLHRTDPNSWLVIFAKDYKDRSPQDAELVDEGVRRLRGFFKKDDKTVFEYEQKSGEFQVAGVKAQKLELATEMDHVEMAGECYAVGHNGIGCWLVAWTPASHAAPMAGEWENLRKGFSFGKDRDGWTEKPPQQLTLKGKEAAYTLSYLEGIWEEQPDLKAEDVLADGLLLGRDVTNPDHADKTATATVLLLPKQENLKAAVAAARTHLEAAQKKVYPETTVEEVEDKGHTPERPDEIGNLRGQLLKLHVKNAEARERFVYLAVVQQPEHVLVVQSECDWRRRTYWEVNFTQLLRQLLVKPH